MIFPFGDNKVNKANYELKIFYLFVHNRYIFNLELQNIKSWHYLRAKQLWTGLVTRKIGILADKSDFHFFAKNLVLSH